MSTNRTENYQLHAWGAEDEESLAEINENFAKLDGASRMVAGTYTGDGEAERKIETGDTPKAVLLLGSGNSMYSYGGAYGGLAVMDAPLMTNGKPVLVITEGGFKIYYEMEGSSGHQLTNQANTQYSYLAVI